MFWIQTVSLVKKSAKDKFHEHFLSIQRHRRVISNGFLLIETRHVAQYSNSPGGGGLI